MVDELEDLLYEDDTGIDPSVKSSDVEEFRVKKDTKHKIVCLLDNHRKAAVHAYDGGEFYLQFYCKSKKGAICCKKLDPPFPYWHNIVFEYVLQRDGKPILPIQGTVKFWRFKRDKYISVRDKIEKVTEEREVELVKVSEFDLDVSLNGEEDYQKMDFTHSMKSYLIQYCNMELRKLIAVGEIDPDENISKELIDKIKKEVEAKKKPGYKFSIDLIRKYSPTMKAIMEEVKELEKHIPRYGRYARNLSVEDIQELIEKKSDEDPVAGNSDLTKDEVESLLDD